LNVGATGIWYAKKVIKSGDTELIDAVDRGEVRVSAAAKRVQIPNTETANKPMKEKRFINPPFKFSKDWQLTDEERGVPPGADLGDHQVKYGRVQIVPKIAKDMRDCRDLWNGSAWPIDNIVSEHYPSPEQIFEALDTLLAHVHTPNARKGNELDYARIGQDLLRTMEKNLPVAIGKLQALAEALAKRRRGRFSVVGDLSTGAVDERRDVSLK
jgi:hypothetical protein